MKKKQCWVCEGKEPIFLGYKCEEHDVCDICGKKRADLKCEKWGTLTGFVCSPCEDARRDKAISDFQDLETNKWVFYHNDRIKCPYCGYEYEPDELHESTDEEECGNCGSLMDVKVEYSVHYTTSKRGE